MIIVKLQHELLPPTAFLIEVSQCFGPSDRSQLLLVNFRFSRKFLASIDAFNLPPRPTTDLFHRRFPEEDFTVLTITTIGLYNITDQPKTTLYARVIARFLDLTLTAAGHFARVLVSCVYLERKS